MSHVANDSEQRSAFDTPLSHPSGLQTSPESVGGPSFAEVVATWQSSLDALVELCTVPAVLVVETGTTDHRVVARSSNPENPFAEGQRITAQPSYCVEVAARCAPLEIINAADDPYWRSVAEATAGMASYLGYPIRWPDGTPFGTLCALDREPHQHTELSKSIMDAFRQHFEADLRVLADRMTHQRTVDEASRAVASMAAETRMLLDHMPCLMARLDRGYRYLAANSRYLEVFGQTEESIFGKHVADVLSEEGWLIVKPFIDRALAGEVVTYERPLPFLGGVRFTEVTYIPDTDADGSICGFYVFALDVHNRRVAEDGLRLSEERFRLMTDSVDGGGWDWDLVEDRVFRSTGWRQAFNDLDDEYTATTDFWLQLCHPDDREKVWAAMLDYLEGRSPEFRTEYRMTQSDGSHVWRLDMGSIVERDGEGRPTRMVGLNIDISERVRAEQTVRESEEDLRATLDSIGDAVIATSLDGIVRRMNPVAEKLTGWPRHEAIGQPLERIFRVVHSRTRSDAEDPVASVLANASTPFTRHDVVLVSRLGTEYDISQSAAPIFSSDGDPRGVVLVFRDIGRETALSEQVRLSEKMQAIGQLAGGIAHDFNNMLGGITSAAEVICFHSGQLLDESSARSLDLIVKTTERASELTSKLLAFARKTDIALGPIDVHRIMNDTIDIVRRTTDRKIDIAVHPHAANPTVNGDSAALQSALMNLAINACHAMPMGGQLTVETSNVVLDEAQCAASGFDLEPGEYLEIAVRDTGRGIAPELINSIFEPFFTTKEQGEGTGLGLSVVYGTVLDHRGAIHVFSKIGHGTTFRMRFRCEAAPGPAATKGADGVVEGTGLILLVDDEDVVATTTQMLLESLGYRVVTANNGRMAIDVFLQQHDEIDAVIMDMNMPEVNGAEAFDHLRAIDRDCPVVISTGYATSDVLADLHRKGIAAVLRKPYRLAALSNLINEVMHTPTARARTSRRQHNG